MSNFLSNQDYRLSSSHDAPEVDNALSTPECQTDKTAPEVAQVLYHTSPPEVVATDPSGSSEKSTIKPPPVTKSRKKKILILISAVAFLLVAALSIGLGVGLTSRKKSRDQTEPEMQNNTVIRPHSLMENTYISAITLPNMNRHIYFREQTGAIRRALYSPQANIWQTAIDPETLPNTRNASPIALTTGLSIGNVFFSGAENDNDVTLFYINSTNQLACMDWGLDAGFSPCSVPFWPNTSVTPDSNQLSAASLMTPQEERGLLLIYQSTEHRSVVLLGYTNKTLSAPGAPQWTWRDATEGIKSAFELADFDPSGDYVTACSVISTSSAFCYRGSGHTSLPIGMSYPSPGNLHFTPGVVYQTPYDPNPGFGYLSDLAPLAGGSVLLLNQSELDISLGTSNVHAQVTLPIDRLPFDHIASSFATGSNKSYVYYQLDDSTFVEDLWDGTSGFWIPTNVSIDTA
ncbi:MAG: hypothetical protein Q9168_004379 [Polycauliona sp. 1 TL-2023]